MREPCPSLPSLAELAEGERCAPINLLAQGPALRDDRSRPEGEAINSVVVTGGSGKAGRAVIQDLLEHGYAVMNVNISAPAEPLCHFFKADLNDMRQAVNALRRAAGTLDRRRSPLGEAEAVIHLAGIPAPSLAPDVVTFQNNLMTTDNVFSAATLFGFKRVVWASSETTYGLPLTRSPPAFAPMEPAIALGGALGALCHTISG